MSDTTTANNERVEQIVAALTGHAIGDALGVPVEFLPRETLVRNPVTGMQGYGTHNQPPGTWSDDTSLTLCAAEALCDGYDLSHMGKLFARWMFEQHWTPHGEVFDIGMTTREAIFKLERVADPTEAGPATENSNGNGSLMRILPVALHFSHADEPERRPSVMAASCLTHGHIRSQLACAIYSELIARLIRGGSFGDALNGTQSFYRQLIDGEYPAETKNFAMILRPDLPRIKTRDISGSGYVIDCLLASLWCCATTESFEEAVLKAVNLGLDTDTTGAVTGGLAALIHGATSVPDHWACRLARYEDLLQLHGGFAERCTGRWKECAS